MCYTKPMIKEDIQKIIKKETEIKDALIEEPNEKSHGDYSTNIAMILAGKEKSPPAGGPREIAKKLVEKIEKNKMFSKVEIAGPGFINFFITPEYLQKEVKKILKEEKEYGNSKVGKSQKVNVEFISANPTGPLTLGNGRGGFGGDVLSNVLKKAGYEVTREFYINDRGKQVKDLKEGLYKGETRTASQIQKANQVTISKDLEIKMNVWFSEKTLYPKEAKKVLEYLDKKKLTYEKEGALWFKTTKFGDDKNRVLIKANKDEAYFLSDIAYLKNKLDRGHKKLFIFLGADHHGYVRRMKSAMKALGYREEQLEFMLFQMVRLLEGKKEIKMSKRAGKFVTIKELVEEVGLDVTRFFFLSHGANSHLNFDLKLAKKKSSENPVYYVQYAHARISSILAKAKSTEDGPLRILKEKEELDLMKKLVQFPEIVKETAGDYQLQRIPQYAIDLAESFHKFYQECQVISDDKKLTASRLALVKATKIVLKNTLNLMGISAPSKM